MSVRGVLFDFGHTLFAHDPLDVTIAGCAHRIGAALTPGQASELAQRIDLASMTPDELAHGRDLDPVVWRDRWEALYGLADECAVGLGGAVYASMHDPQAWTPYLRSVETLRSLHDRGIAVGIVSNTGWDVRAVFAAHAMSGSVTSFTLSFEAGAAKPDRRIFLAAGRSLGLGPHELVMVGDDPVADGGAVRSGIRSLLLPSLPPHADNGVAAVLDLIGVGD